MVLKFRRFATLSLVGLVCCFGITTVFGQQNRSSISGFVFDSERRPISQVFVELQAEFSTVGRQRTDGSGRFYFPGLPHGRYTIRVLPFGTGYLEQSAEVEIAGTGMRGQPVTENVQKDIYLSPRKNASAVPLVNAVIYAQEVPKEAESLYKKAVDDLDSQRTQQGIDGLEKAVAVFPTYFVALQRLGTARLSQERFEDAETIFKKALEINDKSFDCWYGLAYAAYSMRKFAEAVTASEKAVLNRPDSMESNLLLGMSRRATKDYINAETALKQAEKLAEGTSPDVHWNLALLYGKDLNKFDEAAKQLELYLKASPDAPNKDDLKKLIKQFREKSKAKA